MNNRLTAEVREENDAVGVNNVSLHPQLLNLPFLFPDNF